MRKLLFCVALLLPTNLSAAGQEAGGAQSFSAAADAEAVRLLKSEGHRERAWGAYLAGARGLEEHAPLLVALLEDPRLAAGGREAALVRQAALDALIRLDAEVPAEVLRALPRGFSDEAIILLAKSPGENQAALLEIFAGLDDSAHAGAHWLAAGNLLAGVKARGFAARLLGALKVEADVAVLDADVSHGLGRGYGGGGCGCGASYGPDTGFPPVSYYGLTGEAARGAVVVAPGKRPVFYLRAMSPSRNGCHTLPPPADVVRVEYLAALLDTTGSGLGFEALPSFTVICKDTRQCRRELAGVRVKVEQAYAAVVGRLVEKSLLDGVGDAPASPAMTFTLYDERRRKTFPLPDKLRGVTVLVEGREAEPAEDSGEPRPEESAPGESVARAAGLPCPRSSRPPAS